MKTSEIVNEFEESEAILKGHFLLSSGLHSDTYLQCAKVLMQPKRAERLVSALIAKMAFTIDPDNIDLVVAPAMGGLIVGYEVARQLNKPFIFCERVDGQFTFRRGFELRKGQKVLVVEDVVTTGLSSKETFEAIENHGAEVVGEISLIDRSNGTVNLGVAYCALMAIEVATYKPDNLPVHLQNSKAIKPGSRDLKK